MRNPLLQDGYVRGALSVRLSGLMVRRLASGKLRLHDLIVNEQKEIFCQAFDDPACCAVVYDKCTPASGCGEYSSKNPMHVILKALEVESPNKVCHYILGGYEAFREGFPEGVEVPEMVISHVAPLSLNMNQSFTATLVSPSPGKQPLPTLLATFCSCWFRVHTRAVLCCAVLCCAVLCCAVLCCAAVRCGAALYSCGCCAVQLRVLQCAVLCNSLRALDCAVLCGARSLLCTPVRLRPSPNVRSTECKVEYKTSRFVLRYELYSNRWVWIRSRFVARWLKLELIDSAGFILECTSRNLKTMLKCTSRFLESNLNAI
jgi:hypothetical protein